MASHRSEAIAEVSAVAAPEGHYWTAQMSGEPVRLRGQAAAEFISTSSARRKARGQGEGHCDMGKVHPSYDCAAQNLDSTWRHAEKEPRSPQ